MSIVVLADVFTAGEVGATDVTDSVKLNNVVKIVVSDVFIVVVMLSAGGTDLEMTHCSLFHQLSQVAQGRGLKKEWTK